MLVCALPAVCALAIRGPMPIDETRYLSVAWEMWSTHDFVLPALNGALYTHKPPVLFWLMHLGWWLFGVNAWWPRSIPLIAALCSILLTRRLAARLYPEPGTRVPQMATWILAGTVAWTAYVTVLLFDLVLVCWVMLALVALERAGRAPVTSWALYAFALAAGLLTKGPATLVFALPPALLAPWWSVPASRRPGRWYTGLGLALVGALAAAGLWVLAAFEETGATYLRSILWDQSATRIVKSFAHAHPWWFYLVLFPAFLLPWILWPTVWKSFRAGGDPRADRFIIATFVPAFVIFSLISGKQPHYLLPLVPVAALWLAPRVSAPGMTLSGAAPIVAGFMILGAAGAASAVRAEPVDTRIAVGLATFGLALLYLRPAGDRHVAVRRLAVTTSALLSVLTLAFFGTMGERWQLGRAARVVRELAARDVPIAWIGPYYGQFNFLARLQRPVAVLDPREPEEILGWIASHPDGEVVTTSADGREIDVGHELYRQRYRSGWLVIVPASDTRLSERVSRGELLPPDARVDDCEGCGDTARQTPE
jgi:4-amino-4-deoxy-L-arabinose transferase-like glycosyltransferase